MATVKIKLHSVKGVHSSEGTLMYQVTHRQTSRYINTGYKLRISEWDADQTKIILSPETEPNRRLYLRSLENTLQQDLKRLRQIISYLNRMGNTYRTDEIVNRYKLPNSHYLFLAFSKALIQQLREMGKVCTANRYTTTINSFSRFRQGEDIPLENMDADLMISYAIYLQKNKICANSQSFYMRNLRAIYNRAVDRELIRQRNPFKQVYTGISKTVKRAVPLPIIRKIRNLKFKQNSSLDYSRDIFMFSFYTRGMSLIDMAFLKKQNLQNGILTYRRHKTNQQLFIKWEKPMQDLINKYDTSDTPYLLPIIKNNGRDEIRQYKSEMTRINRNLKKIGYQLGLTIPLTSYVARHGWASIAKSQNIPLATISEAMGHDSEKTTRIYLSSLNDSAVDDANLLILNSL